MTQRTKAVETLSVYFENKGRILTPREYKGEKDTPIRFTRVVQIFGSWNRMENIVRTFDGRNGGDPNTPSTDIEEVMRGHHEAAREYQDKMKAASENIHAKTAREEAARAQTEADAMNAKTVQGVIENKMRKGGITSQDAKAKKEAVEHAVAEEHAMLAKTAEGSTLGKKLLGGVEDNDEKTRVIAEQNEMRERTKMKAATPMGAAEAKLMEDDSDGQLTREAQARLRAEQRIFVPPTTEAQAIQAKTEATAKVRPEVKKVVEKAASKENAMTGSAAKASEARDAERINDKVDLPDDVVATMPPADQPVDTDVLPALFPDKDGKTDPNMKVETGTAEPAVEETAKTAPAAASK